MTARMARLKTPGNDFSFLVSILPISKEGVGTPLASISHITGSLCPREDTLYEVPFGQFEVKEEDQVCGWSNLRLSISGSPDCGGLVSSSFDS